MKRIHLLFIGLKVLILIQFVLILTKKESVNSKVYVLTEIVFKLCLSIFIEAFLYMSVIDGLEWEDKLIFSFAGAFLMYDAIFNDLPILRKNSKV